MKAPVCNIEGKPSGREIELNEEVFGCDRNEHVVYLDVKSILAAARQGTHSSKGKSTLSGSTRKLRKQKGGGGARVGSIKSPLFRGGARIFGPTPRDYSFKVNKKTKILARKSVLSDKFKHGFIIFVDDCNLESHKTKDYLKVLENFGCSNIKSLVIGEASFKNSVLGSRNLKKAKFLNVQSINTYDLLAADRLIISEKALPKMYEILIVKE